VRELLQHVFEASLEDHAERTAVWGRGRNLLYRDLEELSNRLARLLQEKGVEPGDRVGLYFPKSPESLVAMLGVLKASAAYVPIDSQTPLKRAAYIIQNCEMKALITTQDRTRILESVTPASPFCVVVDQTEPSQHVPWSALAAFSAARPETRTRDTDLAYILYTSGSTGEPKGVMLTHRNARAFVDWCAATFQIGPEDRLSNHAPLHFDLSVFDVYNTLGAGATLYMVDEGTALFPATLSAFMERHGITVWYSVPSALTGLLLHGVLETRNLSSLRLVLFAGEVFPMKYLRQLAEVLPRVDLYNLYGPTETNVCTYFHVDRAALGDMKSLPIGRACETMEVFAMTDAGRRATAGEEGELWVRGPTVTPGYWGDPERTRRTVLSEPGHLELTYRTGDIVTLGTDGNYAFHGRRDNQIKSRGFRIELGEIEAALLDHPRVREAVVLPIPDEEIGNRLIAVVVVEVVEQNEVTSAQLQQHCALRLPKYMIPGSIEFRERLPKTSTGKVDRAQLGATRGEVTDGVV
jgi:L-proline---[L-prolyl-carrier protein] ligase